MIKIYGCQPVPVQESFSTYCTLLGYYSSSLLPPPPPPPSPPLHVILFSVSLILPVSGFWQMRKWFVRNSRVFHFMCPTPTGWGADDGGNSLNRKRPTHLMGMKWTIKLGASKFRREEEGAAGRMVNLILTKYGNCILGRRWKGVGRMMHHRKCALFINLHFWFCIFFLLLVALIKQTV